MKNFISKPKHQTADNAEAFRAGMVNLGARFNNTYNGWNVPPERMAEAEALRAQYPDAPYPEPVRPVFAPGSLFIGRLNL